MMMMMTKRSENFKRDGFGLLSHLSRESGEGKGCAGVFEILSAFYVLQDEMWIEGKKTLLSSSWSAQLYIHRFYR